MIHLSTRLDLIRMLPAGSVGAEIGCWRGYFASDVLNHTSVKKLYCVDSWRGQTGIYTPEPKTDEQHEADMFEALWHVRGHNGRVEIIRASSKAAATNARHLPAFDWIYIDAGHCYEDCLEDLYLWSRHLKRGGYLMGHDYTECEQAQKLGFGVVKAVTEFCHKEGWEMTHITDEEFASFALQKK